jgi:hypothetical protein
MLVPIAIILTPIIGILAAIKLWHKRIVRVSTVLTAVAVAAGGAWLTFYVLALSSVKCLGSCG